MAAKETWIALFIILISFKVSSFKMSVPLPRLKSTALTSTSTRQLVVDSSGQLSSLEPPRDFLRVMLSSRSSEESKKKLLDKLKGIRVNMNRPGEQQSAYVEYLDNLLVEIDSVGSNVWASRRLLIPLPSLQIKLGSCRRVLKILEEEQTSSSSSSTNQDEANRRRRALAVLLSQLVKQKNGIRGVESEALRRLKRFTMKEMLERTPSGLETPSYEVVDARKTWEVRKYAPFSVCSTVLGNQQERDSSVGFNSLAGYIFGKNIENKAMAMTTPVISSGDMGGPKKKMSFIMPSKFWDVLDSAPTPMRGSGVQLEVGGGGLLDATNTIAVLWFGGYATADKVRLLSQELLDHVDQDVKWKVKDGEEVRLFQYNDPFQPPWKRRNEVAIPVVPRS